MGKFQRAKADPPGGSADGGILLNRQDVHLLLLAVLALLIYSNSFHVPFVFDDEPSIKDNPLIRNLANFFSSGSGAAVNPRRFLGYLSFSLNYRFGGLDVTGYHVVNVAVHITNAFLVYLLVRLTFRTPALRGSALAPRRGFLALATASLFVAHPLHTQAVTYIVQRFTSLATFFYLTALFLYVRWRHAREDGGTHDVIATAAYLGSLLAAVLAMHTKEIAFSLPLIVLLYEIFFFGIPDRKRLFFLAPLLLTIAIIPLNLIGVQRPLREVLSDVSKVTIIDTGLSHGEYLNTQFSVIVTYLRLLFLPVNQNLDYDYPVTHSPMELRAILSILLLLAVLAVAVALYRRSRRGGDSGLRLASFGILWFFVTLMVESSFIVLDDLIFEHRVYLPSIGAITSVVTLAAWGTRQMRGSIVAAVLAAAVLALSLAAYQRNLVWRDHQTLWRDVIRKSPLKFRGHYNLGLAYDRQGRFGEAVGEYRTAIRLNPAFADAHYNLGLIYIRFGSISDGIGEIVTANRLKPGDAEAHYNLANAYSEVGRLGDAVEVYLTAIRLKPDYQEAYCNLGIAYARQGSLDKAAEALATAVRLKPDDVETRVNLAMAYLKLGRLRDAAGEYTVILQRNPGDSRIRRSLEEIERRMKNGGAAGNR